MILTHGANSISGGDPEFLFYTDFSNYNNLIDTPQIGEYAEYDGYAPDAEYIYIYQLYNTLGPFNKKYMRLESSASFKGLNKNYGQIKIKDLITFEFWIKCGNRLGAYIFNNDVYVFVLDSRLHLQVKGSYTCTLYNGTTYYLDSSSAKIIKTVDQLNYFTHVAIVNNKGSIKLYVNGGIRASMVRSTEKHLNKYIRFTGNSAETTTYFAYISVRSGDKSNGDSFTVPTEPYL